MSPDSTIASKIPTIKADRYDRLSRYFTPSSLTLVTAGVTFTLASASVNLLYGISKAPDLPMQLVWGSVAVAASLALALSPTALVRAVASRSVVGTLVASFAIALFGSYSLAGALGSAFGGRETAQLQQQNSASNRTRLSQTYATANAELVTLPPARPVAELDPLIATERANLGKRKCNPLPKPHWAQEACQTVAKLEAERGRAERRAELEETMKTASTALAKSEPAKIANADAVALSTFAAKIGTEIAPDDLNPWLALLAVLLMDLGGGVCFALAEVVRAQPKTRQTAEIEQLGASLSHAVQSLRPAEPVQPSKFEAPQTCPTASNDAPVKLDVPDSFSGRLLVLLKDRGGEVYSGHRALAKAIGCSAGNVGNVLRELSEAGRVTVAATKMGTVVRLAA